MKLDNLDHLAISIDSGQVYAASGVYTYAYAQSSSGLALADAAARARGQQTLTRTDTLTSTSSQRSYGNAAAYAYAMDARYIVSDYATITAMSRNISFSSHITASGSFS